MDKRMRRFCLMIIAIGLIPQLSYAQFDDLDAIEAELDKKAPKPSESEGTENNTPGRITDFSGLGKLAPFSDVAVIQKRFLPKTGRFQLHAAVSTITNDAFFTSNALAGRFAYHLTDSWGLEAMYYSLATDERQVTKDLLNKRAVSTASLLTPKSFYALDIMWSPIYGKFGWMNKRIIPFDMYFSTGFGSTLTSRNEQAPTFHVGTGQIFAKNKSFAFRWDFSWNFYSANALIETKDNSGLVVSSEEKKQSFNNLYISLGISFFFPEATYR